MFISDKSGSLFLIKNQKSKIKNNKKNMRIFVKKMLSLHFEK